MITRKTVRRDETAAAVSTKRGRKSEVKKTEKIVEDNTSYEGVGEMLSTPATTPSIEVSSPRSVARKSSEKRYPKNLSVLQTHERLNTPGSGAKRRQTIGGTPTRKSLGGTPTATPKNKLLSR